MSIEIPTLEPCPFCGFLDGRGPCAFVWRGHVASAFLNHRQYERGAVLVVPNQHVPTVTHATAEQVAQVGRLVRRVALALERELCPTGINVFQNNGVPSGQTVPHYHVHVVPRYPGSERGRLFREQDYGMTPISELESLAEVIRRRMGRAATRVARHGGSSPPGG